MILVELMLRMYPDMRSCTQRFPDRVYTAELDIQPLPYLDSLDIWDTDTRGTRVLSDLGQKSYGMEFTTREVATTRKIKEKGMHIAFVGAIL